MVEIPPCPQTPVPGFDHPQREKHAPLYLMRIDFVPAWAVISHPIAGHLQGEPVSFFPPSQPGAADSWTNPLCYHSHHTQPSPLSLSSHSPSSCLDQRGGPTGLASSRPVLPDNKESKLNPVMRDGGESLSWPYCGH